MSMYELQRVVHVAANRGSTMKLCCEQRKIQWGQSVGVPKTTFSVWSEQVQDVFNQLKPHQAQVLLDIAHSSWLEGAEPTRSELEVLARQIRGQATADQALALLLPGGRA